jgi:hypothetical protein
LTPRRSLRGLWRGLTISADDITAAPLSQVWDNDEDAVYDAY